MDLLTTLAVPGRSATKCPCWPQVHQPSTSLTGVQVLALERYSLLPENFLNKGINVSAADLDGDMVPKIRIDNRARVAPLPVDLFS